MNHPSPIKRVLESLLFASEKSLSIKELAKYLEQNPDEIKNLLEELVAEYSERGMVITKNGETYQMVTSPETAEMVANFTKNELRERLSDAGIETLAIISYKQPISKPELESIRGVNCQYVLRLLEQRGLVEKVPHPSDKRGWLYQTTHEFLHFLGLKSVEELPEFEDLSKNLEIPENEAK